MKRFNLMICLSLLLLLIGAFTNCNVNEELNNDEFKAGKGIIIQTPTSGTYITGNKLVVSWDKSGIFSKGFGIDLYRSSGSKYGYVIPSPTNSTSYTWIPAHSTTGDFFIRVYDAIDTSIYDDSAVFKITN